MGLDTNFNNLVIFDNAVDFNLHIDEFLLISNQFFIKTPMNQTVYSLNNNNSCFKKANNILRKKETGSLGSMIDFTITVEEAKQLAFFFDNALTDNKKNFIKKRYGTKALDFVERFHSFIYGVSTLNCISDSINEGLISY